MRIRIHRRICLTLAAFALLSGICYKNVAVAEASVYSVVKTENFYIHSDGADDQNNYLCTPEMMEENDGLENRRFTRTVIGQKKDSKAILGFLNQLNSISFKYKSLKSSEVKHKKLLVTCYIHKLDGKKRTEKFYSGIAA